MCSITLETAKIANSYGTIYAVQVSAAEYQTVPTVAADCSRWSFEAAVLPIKPNICSYQYEPIAIFHSITLPVVIQLCSPRCWHLGSNYYRTRCRQWQLKSLLLPLLMYLCLLEGIDSKKVNGKVTRSHDKKWLTTCYDLKTDWIVTTTLGVWLTKTSAYQNPCYIQQWFLT